jgi:hypothetical protein
LTATGSSHFHTIFHTSELCLSVSSGAGHFDLAGAVSDARAKLLSALNNHVERCLFTRAPTDGREEALVCPEP